MSSDTIPGSSHSEFTPVSISHRSKLPTSEDATRAAERLLEYAGYPGAAVDATLVARAYLDSLSENARLRDALKFYEDPWEYQRARGLTDKDEDWTPTPDFYDELDFGRRAREAAVAEKK